MSRSNEPVPVLGTGAIGSAVARALLAAGRRPVVWNRTAEKAVPLVEAGAVPAATPEEALTAGSLAIVTLADHAAVGGLLDGVEGRGAADLTGRTVVVLVTGSPDESRAAAQRFRALGASYLDGGIQAAPASVGTPSATFLLSGSRTAYDEHRATLEVLGTVRFVGERPDAAAILDLALFGAWYDAQLGLLRALDLARTAGVDPDLFAETVAAQLDHVPRSAADVVAEVREGEFPAGPASLVEHLPVIRRLLDAREHARLGDGGLRAIADRVEREIAAGRRQQGLTALIG
jgi:3-hydroxyisobutyrate dehydrogenase-like beta-hydroxyacid dehydrogenase